MNLIQLGRNDRGVTPVVGIILLVAIAVILASVVAVFALGIGDQTGTSPTAKFSFEYDAPNLTITHDSGENIPASNVYIRGDSGSSGEDLEGSWDSTDWDIDSGDHSATVSGESAISSGDSLVIEAGSDYDISVVWQSPEGDRSAELGEDIGPDA